MTTIEELKKYGDVPFPKEGLLFKAADELSQLTKELNETKAHAVTIRDYNVQLTKERDELKLNAKNTCDVCWTSSFAPLEASEYDEAKVSHHKCKDGKFVICQHCELEFQFRQLQSRLSKIEAQNGVMREALQLIVEEPGVLCTPLAIAKQALASQPTHSLSKEEGLANELSELRQESDALAKWGDKHGRKGEHSVWETLDNLVDEVESLRRDKDRLDWLEQRFFRLSSWALGEEGKNFHMKLTGQKEVESKDIRQAIDAAIANEEKGGE